MSANMIEIAKRHFDLSFEMLEKMISQCPDEVWYEKRGGFVFWQQLLHAFTGASFWMRQSSEKFVEPFAGMKLYPELDQEPEDKLNKEDLVKHKNEVKVICGSFFDGKDDEWLSEGSIVYSKITNMDIVFMQIRHIQYHVGHCNSILRGLDIVAVDWLDYYGK